MIEPLRVGLVDDHAVVRSGYRRLLELESDFAVAAEFVDAESTYAALAAPGPCPIDLLVLDLSLPGQSGLELLRHLRSRLPSLPVLVFTMHDSAALVQQSLRAGAAGFVTKSSEPGTLLEALRRIARGEIVLSDDVALALAPADTAPAPHAALSVREFDIFQRLVLGHDVDRIAQTLHLSAKTVANYQTEIRRKLGTRNAVELVRYARMHGIATL